MSERPTFRLTVIVTASFNMAATMSLIDPFRAANYIEGRPLYAWHLASPEGTPCRASNGLTLETTPLAGIADPGDLAIVSTSWTPEAHASRPLIATLRRWARRGLTLAGLDTGAFILAEAGLLQGRRATVHYEHIDAFRELYPETDVSEDLLVFDGPRLTCAGGAAAADLALNLIRAHHGDTLANAAARYTFHAGIRAPGIAQNAGPVEPLGTTIPAPIRQAIALMEAHLEEPLAIPEICRRIGLSHRQLNRLFARYLGKPPALYYRDIRLDRARGLVTQTTLPLAEIAIASGFASQVHFSRAYRTRFGLTARADRIEGRVPFQFRAWPMHRPTGQSDA